MKVCPICKARCFDDMEVCYGCMHRFDFEGETFKLPGAEEAEQLFTESATGNRKHSVRSAYVFGASGSASDEPVREAAKAIGSSVFDGEGTPDSGQLAAIADSLCQEAGSSQKDAEGQRRQQSSVIADGEVARFMQAALESGRRLVLCVD